MQEINSKKRKGTHTTLSRDPDDETEEERTLRLSSGEGSGGGSVESGRCVDDPALLVLAPAGGGNLRPGTGDGFTSHRNGILSGLRTSIHTQKCYRQVHEINHKM